MKTESYTTYKTEVYKYLDEMNVGRIEIKRLVKPDNRPSFIEAAKEYIDEKHSEGWCDIELIADYDYCDVLKRDIQSGPYYAIRKIKLFINA